MQFISDEKVHRLKACSFETNR